MDKYRFWINNGRVNEVWQIGCHNKHDAFVRDRYPMAIIEMNPDDAGALGIASGDVVDVHNDYGSWAALMWWRTSGPRPTPSTSSSSPPYRRA